MPAKQDRERSERVKNSYPELITERIFIKQEHIFVKNDIEEIIDIIYALFEEEKIISFVADEIQKSPYKQAAQKSKSEFFLKLPITFPKNIGAIVLAKDTQDIELLTKIAKQGIKIFIIGNPLIKIKNIYKLPSFSKGYSKDVLMNLDRLSDAINSIRNIYDEQVKESETELHNLTIRLKVATMNANRALDRAFHEVAETKKYINQLKMTLQ